MSASSRAPAGAWRSTDGRPVAVVMEYRGLSPQPLFVMGDRRGIRGILRDVIRTRAAYLAATPGTLPRPSAERYQLEPARRHGPHVGRPRLASGPCSARPSRLDVRDTRHLNRLYELGLTSWLPAESVAAGIYYGIRRGTRLVAAAGTHVISPTYGLAAVGNVYTSRDYRGQGSPRSSPAP